MRRLEILRISGGERESRQDLVTEEVSLRLLAGHRRIAVLMCSPGDLEDLIRGFFYSNRFISRADQIRRIVINRATWSAFIELDPGIDPDSLRLGGVVGSACGSILPLDEGDGPSGRDESHAEGEACGEADRVESALRVSSRRISDLMEELRSRSKLHRRTGGVHAAALAGPGGVIIFREDIGRHNAVDKVIGAWLLQDGGFDDKILLTSGRLSSEILGKARACSLPVVVSRSAPTDRSVAAARRQNITLIGFARGRRMNVYSAAQRILGEEGCGGAGSGNAAHHV
ncbi:MAG: formate dehydrogenase accessory sulfurtransferase FdhD [Spirochaetales bacterium]|nr:formate dehydrogenase accessory sulfurtransferase FdhD [Spirochaetales bacterium]